MVKSKKKAIKKGSSIGIVEICLRDDKKLNFSLFFLGFGFVSGILQNVHKDHKNHHIPTEAILKRTIVSSISVSWVKKITPK